MAMSWWLWLLVGMGLLLLELITPGGFFIFFFGVGAVIVGVLAVLGIAGSQWFQWLLFGSLSAGALLLFRKPLQQKLRIKTTHEVDTMIGETAIALADIGIREVGKAELRGSAWTARNIGTAPIALGQRCRVTAVDGLTLHIQG